MKKSLLLFIIFTILLFVAQFAYTKYCKTKPDGCKQTKIDENNVGPQKGIDW